MGYKRTINKFNRGEVDENFLARDDVERIVDTSSSMENFMPIRLGPMQYRPGTQYLAAAAVAESIFQIPFLAANNESVVLEFFQTSANPSVEGFRVLDDGALVTCTATADTITNGTFATDLTGWTDGDDVGGTSQWIAGAAWLTGNGIGAHARLSQSLTVTAAAERTLKIEIESGEVEVLLGTAVDNGSIFRGYLKRGVHLLTFTPAGTTVVITLRNDKAYGCAVATVAYEAAGALTVSGTFFPDTSTDALVLKTLKYAQSADVLFLVSDGYRLEGRAYPIVRVERRGTKSWSLTKPDMTDGPFGTINLTEMTLTPSVTTGDGTLTASLATFVDSTWVGRSFKIVHAAVEGVCIITAINTTTEAYIKVTVPFGATTASADWYPGLFAEYLPGPTAVALFDGRLWLGGAGQYWGSVSDAYLSFDQSLEGNSKAISKTIGFGPVQQVNWMSAGDELLAGTASGILRIGSNDFEDVITAENCKANAVVGIGTSTVIPERIDAALYFIQRAGKRVFEVTEAAVGDRAKNRDLLLLHPDLCDAGIVRIALTRHPEPRIFVVLADGTMAVCLIESAETVTGWVPLSFGEMTVLDVAVLPDNEEDEVYLVTLRGSTKYLERLSKFSESIGGAISRHYDSNVYEATPGTTISGLTHLNNESVHVWADGREYGPYTVSGGAITVPANSWAHSVTGIKHTATWISNRLGQYIPASVLSARKRVFNMGLVARDVALSTILYGDGDEMYPIARVDIDANSAPSLLPQVGGTLTGYDTGSGAQAVVRGNGYIYMLVGGSTYGASLRMSVAHDNSPRITNYGISGTTFTKLSDPATLPPNTGRSVAWDPSGRYQAVGHDQTPFITVYDWDSGVPVKLADPGGADLPGGVVSGVSWSQDLELCCAHSGGDNITRYSLSTGSFVKLAAPADPPSSASQACAYSEDGDYLAMGIASSPYVWVYSRSGSTLTKLANPASLPTGSGQGVAWSLGAAFLAVAHPSSPRVTVYSRSAAVLTKLSDPATLPAGTGYSVAFSPDDAWLAVGHVSTPYVTIYAFNAGAPVKITNPASLPTGQTLGIAFSRDSRFLAAAHQNSPFATIYDFQSGAPVKLSNPASLPASNANAVAFSPDV